MVSFWASLKRSWSPAPSLTAARALDQVQAAGVGARDLAALLQDQVEQLVDVALGRQLHADLVEDARARRRGARTLLQLAASRAASSSSRRRARASAAGAPETPGRTTTSCRNGIALQQVAAVAVAASATATTTTRFEPPLRSQASTALALRRELLGRREHQRRRRWPSSAASSPARERTSSAPACGPPPSTDRGSPQMIRCAMGLSRGDRSVAQARVPGEPHSAARRSELLGVLHEPVGCGVRRAPPRRSPSGPPRRAHRRRARSGRRSASRRRARSPGLEPRAAAMQREEARRVGLASGHVTGAPGFARSAKRRRGPPGSRGSGRPACW